MTYAINTGERDAACDAIVDEVDAGASNGYIEFRTGAPPATPGDEDSGTLLATCNCSDPAFGSSSSGTATANAISDDSDVDASGTAGHFRIKDSDGNVHSQGTVTATGGGGDFEFDTVDWVAGGTVSVSSLTITVPAS